jgi:radical SAM superfamily enzyme YgiQ (UPF0313 family)
MTTNKGITNRGTMNILLICPKYPNTFWSFKYALAFVSKNASCPPLGLMTVGAMLPKEWNKKLIDVNVTKLKDEHIAWADMVFIGAMLIQKGSAQEIIKRCKSQGKIVVAGGPAFTTQHETFDGVDHLVLNEAEVTLPLFLEDLKNNKAKPIYTSEEKPDITKTSIPLWSLIDFKNYSTMSLQYSRGCPFDCEFCDIVIMNGRVQRTKTPEQLINELQSLYDAGWRGSVFIVDDNFIGNKAKVKSMLPVLIEWQRKHKYPFTLLTEATVNLADDIELMQMMSTANFYKVFIGIETPNNEGLKECNKMQNTSRNLADSIKAIQQHGMQVMGGFIVGFDSDTESIFETQIKFIQKTGVVTAMVGLLNALPQTRLWHRLKDEGRLLRDTSGENTDGSINFIPKMGKYKLVKGYKELVSKIYSPKEYYKRMEILIKNYRPTVKGRISKNILGAFFKSLWTIGVLSNARFLYWKSLIKTFFIKVKAINLVVELAIYRQHFEKVAKQISAS